MVHIRSELQHLKKQVATETKEFIICGPTNRASLHPLGTPLVVHNRLLFVQVNKQIVCMGIRKWMPQAVTGCLRRVFAMANKYEKGVRTLEQFRCNMRLDVLSEFCCIAHILLMVPTKSFS